MDEDENIVAIEEIALSKVAAAEASICMKRLNPNLTTNPHVRSVYLSNKRYIGITTT